MSGGANYGAWEAGILWGLTHYGNPEDFAWDIITGVSAGAINTAATVMFNVGDEVKMSEFLSDSWASLTTP
jgi:predicted acylesterase/phospholipase RssA